MLPPNIYGVGTGPFNRTTIQIPLWIKEAVREGHLISQCVAVVRSLPCLLWGSNARLSVLVQRSRPSLEQHPRESQLLKVVLEYLRLTRPYALQIANLVTAYLTLLSHLEQTTSTPPLYVIAETGEHRWGDLAPLVEKELKQRGLIKSDAETVVDPEGSVETETGTQSRSKAEWLHDWGWQVKRLPSVAESLPTEIDEMQRTGAV